MKPSPAQFLPVALHWRDAEDSAFFASLENGGFSRRLARPLSREDLPKAKRLVLEHFHRRASPRWLFDFRTEPADRFPTRNYFWGPSIAPEEAAEILNYRVRDPNCRTGWQELGSEVDWRRGGTADYGSSGWLVLHFWYWALFAAAGYAMTRDERYARVFERCWHRWQEEFPFEVDPESVARGGSFSPEHSVMRAGRRLLVLTDVLYSGLLAALDQDTAFAVLKYVWFVSAQYLRLPHTANGRFRYQPGNHNLFDAGVTPYCIGMLWPEFPHAALLVGRGRILVRRHVRHSIQPEGTSVEHSSRYAWYVANMHVQAMEVARLNGDALLAGESEQKLRRFLWTLVELTAPDGRLIPFGDCQPPPKGLQFHTYRALFADAAIMGRAAAYGVDLRCGCAPAASQSGGKPPGLLDAAGHHYSQSGMALVRDGLGPDSTLLWIVADPRETAGHGHFDFTSFQFWCRGVPLVLDTAGFGYRIEEIVPAERAFYYSPFGHSLLTVDGLAPVCMETMGDVRRWWGSKLGDGRIETARMAGTAGQVVCSHRSYPGVEVRRTYDFDLTRREIVVSDDVQFAAAGRHTCRQLLHLAFGLSAATDAAAAAVATPAGTVRFSFSGTVPLSVRCVHSPLARRAATVFGLGAPHILLAESDGCEGLVRIACRISWE